MLITFNETRNRFEAQTSYAESGTANPLLKGAGFAFDYQGAKVWHTAGYEFKYGSRDRNPKYPLALAEQALIAGKLFEYCDPTAKGRLAGHLGVIQQMAERLKAQEEHKATSLDLSRATTTDIQVPCPEGIDPDTGKQFAYLPYQRAGIVYAMQRSHTLIGDEMGLGKTIQGIGISNADPTVKSVLIVCPATPKLNWRREWRKWDVKHLTVGVMDAKSKGLTATDVVIINFDVAKKFQDLLRTRTWDLLIIDEAHKVKNPDAQRTVAILGKKATKKKDKKTGKMIPVPAVEPIAAKRHAYLTGTPIPNRPVELWPMVERLDPNGLGKSFWKFANRYCDAKQTKFGWDFNGASNLDELQELLRATFMVRRLKIDVLKDLPPKRRQVVLVEPDAKGRALIEKEKVAYENVSMKPQDGVTLSEMSRLRKEVAVYKVPFVIEHVDDMLEGGIEKICIFAHHKEVVDALMAHYGNAAVKIDGRVTKIEDRQAAVDRFQKDPTCKIFVGSILAAGVAITLTAAAYAVFAEIDWVPGNNSQAEDRIHRIGQTLRVLIQYILLEDSLDANMINKIMEKLQIIDAALDKQHDARPAVATEKPKVGVPEPPKQATVKVKGVETVVVITPEQTAAIHAGLKMLKARCDGAFQEDGAGFAKIDVQFGHSLAMAPRLSMKQAAYGQKFIRKYQGQLPEELVLASGVQPKGAK
jgi:SNF2 family DNA or RNA helicase